MTACIGEPVSWMRLELFALDPSDAAVAAHVEACPACGACLAQLRADRVVLPPLTVAAAAPRRRWWLAFLPVAGVAAAVVLLVVVRPREPGEPAARRGDVALVTGVGEVVLRTVRERDGAIRSDAATYAPGDRWKVMVTCAPGPQAWVDVAVLDAGAVDYPLGEPAAIACGNDVVVPGAFAITGDRPNQICVRVAASAGARVAPRPGDPDVACVTVRRE
ncbi:MAG: hypothetical protein KIT31_29285 [Deltaproteobacteria bacterium]|nr:hypothetical protein [Deltaproteobacteria bacterium]